MKTSSSSALEILEARIAPATLYAVTDQNHLIRFESTSPDTIDLDVEITGIGAGEAVHGIDTRPATGELFILTISDEGATNSGRIYTLDPLTGVATQVGATPFSTTLADGARYGFDFNPTVDRIRVVSSADANLRVNPNDGTLTATDANLDEAEEAESINAVAYTSPRAGATFTTLFGIDFTGDQLVRIGGLNGMPSPNGGVVTSIGLMGGTFGSATGFDIGVDEVGYAALTDLNAIETGLYTINLFNGAASKVGKIGSESLQLRGLTVASVDVKISADGKTATYTDVDGDIVTVKTSKGEFDASDFALFSVGGAGRGQLAELNLSNDDAEFAGANLTFIVKKGASGDGLVDVGYINAAGVDLGAVKMKGDLGRISAGDGDLASVGLASLAARSVGALTGQTPTEANDFSSIVGKMGALKLTGDLQGAFSVSGALSKVAIGGSLNGGVEGGRLSAQSLGAVKIGGDIIGGTENFSGSIRVTGDITSLAIGGSLIGGDALGTGMIRAGGKIGTVKIADDIHGGTGSLVAFFGGAHISGGIVAHRIGIVTIGGSMTNVETTASFSGLIASETAIGSITIKGDLAGTANTPVRIVAGGFSDGMAPIAESVDLALGKLTVGGRVQFADTLVGFRADLDTDTFLGTDFFWGLQTKNNNASVGTVKVGKDWIASNLVAGAQNLGADNAVGGSGANADNVNFGDEHDTLLPSPAADSLVSRIASVTIKGRILGDYATGNHYGFVAQQIGKISALGVKTKLTSATDPLIPLALLTGDVAIHEIA